MRRRKARTPRPPRWWHTACLCRARRAAPETAPAMGSLRSSRVECREMTIALRPNRLGCNLLAPSYYSPEPLYL